MLKVFEDAFAKLEVDYEFAKEKQDKGAVMKALDLIHQTRIRQYEVEVLLTQIKEQNASEKPKLVTED